jgi:periplasmic copper chaperone A
MRTLVILGTLIALPALAQPAPASNVPASGVHVDNAWARATASRGQAGAVYFTMTSTAADQLTGASTPVAQAAELHESRMNGSVMQMRAVPVLPVTPGHPVTLAPGGYHMMLTGLKQPLKVGDHFPLTLTFAHAAPVTADVTVARAGASQPAPMDGMPGMDMSHPAR